MMRRWIIRREGPETGTISFSSAGRHRRVLLPDLVKYEENLRTERKAFLK